MNDPIAENTAQEQPKLLTCFDIFWQGFYVLCALVLGRYLWARFGWPLGLLGSISGYALGWIGIRLFVRFLDWQFPPFPVCRQNRCRRPEDYRYLEETNLGFVFACRCGDRYLKQSRRVLELLPNGFLRPYQYRRYFGGWKPDARKEKVSK